MNGKTKPTGRRRSRYRQMLPVVCAFLPLLVLLLYLFRPHPDDDAADQIEKWGGQVQRESRIPIPIVGEFPAFERGPIWVVRYVKGPVTVEMLAILTKLRGLKNLSLYGRRPIAKDGLVHLSQLHQVENLYLGQTDIGDEDLRFIADLSNLRSLYINDTKVTDACIVHLANLKKLRMVEISNTKITDAGAAELAKLLPTTYVARDEEPKKVKK